MQNKQHRPTGVTIIAILTIISGILLLLSGITLVALGALFSGNSSRTSSQAVAQFFGVISVAVGGVLLPIGIGYIVVFYGLLKGKGWAWTNYNITFHWNRYTNTFHICNYSFFS
jgi:hypothetical protein